jgi:hypothetical protein
LQPKGSFENGNVFVLINSASSEILAEPFKIMIEEPWVVVLWKRIGTERMDFADGSAVRLTIAGYTPTGRSIQNPIRKAMRLTLRNQSLVLEMENCKKDIKVADTLKFKTKKVKLYTAVNSA